MTYGDSMEYTEKMGRKIRSRSFPKSFSQFFHHWMLLLQGFVLPKYVAHLNPRATNESATIREFAQDNERTWEVLNKEPIQRLVEQRYIRTSVLARNPEHDHKFVDERVRFATDYLRFLLGVDPATIIGLEEQGSNETGRRPDMSRNPYVLNNQPFTALMVLLYKIRCNLFHGVKGYRIRSERNEMLTSLGSKILEDIIEVFERPSRV